MKIKRSAIHAPHCILKFLTGFAILFLAGSSIAPISARAATYSWVRSAGTGASWTQSLSTNYSPTPPTGGPGASDNLVMASTDGLNLSGDRQIHDLSSIVSLANIGGGSSVSTLLVHGNISLNTTGAALIIRNGSGINTTDVTVKGGIDISQGVFYAGLNTGNGGLKTLVVEGATTISGTFNNHRSNTSGISLGNLTVNSGGLLNLIYGANDVNGSYTSTLTARSLSGSGTVIGSDMGGTDSRNATLSITGSSTSNANFGGSLQNGSANSILNLTVAGSGIQTLSGSNSFTGATTISGAKLVLSGSGSINHTSGITINSGGTLIQNSSITLNAPITFTNGTIGGSGAIASNLTIGANRTLSPGNSPGSQTFIGSQTWEAGGNYNWQIYDASGAAGVGYDTLNVTGTLNLLSLTSDNRFNLNLWSLAGVGPDANGEAINFNALQSSSWLIATADLISFSGNINDLFELNLSSTNGTSGFQNSFTGTWSVSVDGAHQQLILNYSVVPEPGSMFLLSSGFAALGMILRRKTATKRA